ncbi:tetratricopeptide repeat protein [Asticcacaulis solisilvae]|uniref:tetratricopeptide repeat protein n=1 Tax=Asticcacaulis solisilvae TaxID=1217274 RepID=UPI003FD725A1
MRLVSLAALAVALGLAVQPAAASTSTARAAPVLHVAARPVSPYAQFLVGRFAMNMGDVKTASQSLTAASDADPDDSDLREKAFLVAILNGDIDTAQRLIPKGPAAASVSPTGKLMTTLVTVTTAVRDDHAPAAMAALDTYIKAGGDERTAALMRPYVQAMAGKWTEALDSSGDATLAASERGALLVFLLKAERARIYEIRKQPDEADALYKALYQPGAASLVFGPDYAGFLERQGRKDDARAVWKTLVDTSGDPLARAALARLDGPGYKPVPLPDLKTSIAQALLMSATLYSGDRDTEMALADLRLTLYLDPSNDRARLFLGQTEQDMKAPELAEAAWAEVPASSPYGPEAGLRRIWSLRARGENDTALTLIEDGLTANPADLTLTVEKADVLHDQGKDQDALKVINDRIAAKGEADMTWQAWFITAIAYDATDNWDKAEAAIQKARTLNPQRPEILNFLGYGWIDRGLHVKEGMDLVRQAMSLSPRSGAIVDSLGWGYYKLGDYEQALGYVEQAAQLEPADPEVNEHLGDVYKALGRTAEARYEWQRVLSLQNVTPKTLAAVKAKLDASAAVAKAAEAPKPETTAYNDKAPAKAKPSE